MKAILVRIAADKSYGKWNGPVDQGGEYVYVPIPERSETAFHPNLRRGYSEVMPALERFGVPLPAHLHDQSMHLDPDFAHLTYGDVGSRRGKQIAGMTAGDVIAFYAGLRPVYPCEHRLVYAMVGLYVVDEVVTIEAVEKSRWHENAHTRKVTRGPTDIVVRAKPGLSGRMRRCVPIGERRDGVYRIRHDVLEQWGGLGVKDGYVQRSAVPPRFLRPEKFYDWFLSLGIELLRSNH